ncbi:MAG: hypothetical protein JW874_07325 [Spirochaetales bacterium]|nr:hypothetical protein [Spirochaetales bacterium]
MNTNIFRLFIFVMVLVFTNCIPPPEHDNSGDRRSDDYEVGVTVVSPVPETSTLVMGFQEIILQFTDPMDIESLAISGDFAGLYTATWDTDTYENDTLTLSPLGGTIWSNATVDGAAQTLTLEAESIYEAVTGTVDLDFVLRNAIAVSESGNDSNPGTADLPMATIAGAITRAGTEYPGIPSAVLVSVGEYTVSSAITMVENISVYGDYAADFSGRGADGESVVSGLQDTGGISEDPNCVFLFDIGITRQTVLDGFALHGSGGEFSAALLIQNNSAPTISGNSIFGGSAEESADAVFINLGSPLIENCQLYFGDIGNLSGTKRVIQIRDNDLTQNSSIEITSNIIGNDNDSGDYDSQAISIRYFDSNDSVIVSHNIINGGYASNESYGFYLRNNESDTNLVIYNNVLHGGSGHSYIYGIYSNGGAPHIYNNTILVGDPEIDPANQAYCIYLRGNSTPEIINNILCASQGSGDFEVYCIYERPLDTGSDPSALNNNAFFNLWAANSLFGLYYDADTDSIYSTITAIQSGETAINNVDDDPAFSDIDGIDNTQSTMSDNNWSLSSSTPTSITDGGYNGSIWGFTDDIILNPRTSPWSIGAYEYQ